jgi:hypothetical protein
MVVLDAGVGADAVARPTVGDQGGTFVLGAPEHTKGNELERTFA